jgi:hypothetical protein
MPVKVIWNDEPPNDREEWEDILRAEYGTAMGDIVFHLEQDSGAWRLACVEEQDFAGAHGATRLDQRQRFATALCAAGKPVVESHEPIAAEGSGELESVTVEGLNDRTERARREGKSGE